MLRSSEEPQVFIRYGLSRKKNLLRDTRDWYDGLVIPANLLLYQYRGTPAVIYYCRQPFFIDPMSYLFAYPFEDFKKRITKGESKFKPSYVKLIEGYGEDPEILHNQNYYTLVQYLLNSKKELGTFINNCMNFQFNNVNDTINNSKEFLQEDESLDFRPEFLIPPYFLFSSNGHYNELNFSVLDYCWGNKTSWENIDIFPMLLMQKESLNEEFIKELKNRFGNYDFPGYCLWVENFDERLVTVDQITNLMNLIEVFSEGKSKQIVLLFGGFFSMLLFKYGLNCISHGIAYSEMKSMHAAVRQMGGGVPIRYYIPELHQFLTIKNSLQILRIRKDLLCNCPICQRLVQSDPENITRFEDEEELAELHFLYNRRKEKSTISRLNGKDIIKYLDYIYNLNSDISTITKPYKISDGFQDRPIINPEYVKNWQLAFKKKPPSD